MHYRPHVHICPTCKEESYEMFANKHWIHYPLPVVGCNAPVKLQCENCNPELVNGIGVYTKGIPFSVDITDPAKLGLIQQAYSHGCIKSLNMERYHGLGDYIERYAARQVYVDNRPDYMRSMDGIKRHFKRKFWIAEGDVTRRNTFKLTVTCLTLLRGIGEDHGICNMYRLSGPIEHRAVISLVLEAIGRGWLKPDVG